MALLKGNKKSWDEYLPQVEFGFNRVVKRTTTLSPFEVVYGFITLTPTDLLPLPENYSLIHKEGVSRLEFIKMFREKVKAQIKNIPRNMLKATTKGVKYNNLAFF